MHLTSWTRSCVKLSQLLIERRVELSCRMKETVRAVSLNVEAGFGKLHAGRFRNEPASAQSAFDTRTFGLQSRCNRKY